MVSSIHSPFLRIPEWIDRGVYLREVKINHYFISFISPHILYHRLKVDKFDKLIKSDIVWKCNGFRIIDYQVCNGYGLKNCRVNDYKKRGLLNI